MSSLVDHESTITIMNQTSEPTNEAEIPEIISDWVLQEHIQQANRHGIGQSITLFVSGIVVSGALLPAQEYFKRIAKSTDESVSRNLNVEPTGKYGKHWLAAANLFPYLRKDEEETDIDASSKIRFVHLEQARFYFANGTIMPPMDAEPMLWRGRISEVSGFMLGSWYSTKISDTEEG